MTFSDGTFVGRMLIRGVGEAAGDSKGDSEGVGDAVADGDGGGVGEVDADGDTAAVTWLPAPQAVTSRRTVALTWALTRPD